ncbi:hypothetical protein [Paracoccus sp. Ld10]|uniref:hypothetical protein n=1 Tax=Paracoccus sp. Ld10 TaxID=649158 RepID=UPI00386EB551
MGQLHNDDDISALWDAVQTAAALRLGDPMESVLADVLRARGTIMSPQEVSFALHGANRRDTLTAERFADCMVALLGAPALRRRHAFAAFPAAPDGTIAKADLLAVILAFADDADEATLLSDDIDADGDGRISLSDLDHFVATSPAPQPGVYRASHVAAHHVGSGTYSAADAVLPSRPQGDNAGMSPLALKIGFFRLMQGAAYRSFRENYAANSETHIRARDLPYTVEDFAHFTTAAIDYYLALGIVTDPECVAEFRRLDTMVQDEVARLHARIQDWPRLPKTPAMLAAQANIATARQGRVQRQDLAHAVLEFVLSMRAHGLGINQASAEAMVRHELNRLRHVDLRGDSSRAPALAPQDPYIDSWNSVIVSDSDLRIDGAVMPTQFWYDDFMPQLLLCASISSADDLRAMRSVTEAALDAWHAAQTASGAFDAFATDLRDGFAACSHPVKQALQQAWVLTAPYLSGVEKARERDEFGRATGYLSEYVAFVDVHLGRHDVASSDMRLSFPYYIGPAVWGFLHGAAELVEAMPGAMRAAAIEAFVMFFHSFATMYPCPYCRYHLNRYVIRNREVDMYPVEFLLLGRKPDQQDLSITLDDKLATVAVPGGLRTFLWKLHNAVSSSIARTEPWYHRQPEPIYTNRFWPSFESEMAYAAAHGQATYAVADINMIYRITKPAARLAVLRDELGLAFFKGDTELVRDITDRADGAISDLTQAVGDTEYLTKKYFYNVQKVDAMESPEDGFEAFARSGVFVER